MPKYKFEVASVFLLRYKWQHEGGDLWWRDKTIHDIPTDQAVEKQRLINGLVNVRNWDDLTTVPTRQLMAWREGCYRCAGGRTTDYNHGYDPNGDDNNPIPLCEILIELANREHVPNKQESKALRQQKARIGR
jgi:hypothetical protein